MDTPERITAERFEDNLEAYLYYLLSLPPEETVAGVLELWRQGGWRADPHAFLNKVWVVTGRSGDALTNETCGQIWLDALRELPWAQARSFVFRNAFQVWASCSAGLLRDACAWLAEVAEPGDADIIVDGLAQLLPKRGDDALALVDWTLANGVSAFRNPTYLGPLGETFLLVAQREDRREGAQLLLTLLATVDRGLSDAIRDDETFWNAVQACQAGDVLIANVVKRLLDDGRSDRGLSLLGNRASWPCAWDAVFGLLGAGEVPAGSMTRAWEQAFRGPAPVATGALRTPAAIEAGLETLHAPFDHNEHSASWAQLLACAWWSSIAADASLARRPFAHRSIFLMAGHPKTTEGIRLALSWWLEGRPDEASDLARALLDERDPARVKAALLVAAKSCEGGLPALTGASAVSVASLQARLAPLILRPLGMPAYGVDIDLRLAACMKLELTVLDRDDKVRVDGASLLVDESFPRRLIDVGFQGDELLKLAALYVMHELVHHDQGIGDYALVGSLRAAGGETTLLHLDLAADHAAALAVHRAVPSWSLAELKGLITRSLSFFPARGLRTAASRVRKSLRAASSQLDARLHELGVGLDASMGGYWYIDLCPLGGDAFAVAAGPPMRLAAKERFTTKEADTVLNASLDDNAMAAARPIIERLVSKVVAVTR